MIKDLENIKGDLANDYKTIPILHGELTSKKIITFLTLLTVFPVYLLIEKFEIGNMDLYFYSCLLFLLLFLLKLWKSDLKEHYLLLHNLLKFLIVSGVFSIILINPSIVEYFWHKIVLLF
jgi:4-hydroxybenzoate polyprenyltransferase